MTAAAAPQKLLPPPRSTGNINQDFSDVVNWTYFAYLAIQAAIDNIQAGAVITALQAEADATKAQATATQTQVGTLQTEADATQAAAVTLKARLDGQITGTVTMAHPNNSFTITFGTPEADANYRAIVQAIDSTGSPNVGAAIVVGKTYLAASFTVIMADEPGIGNTVTYEWQLIRNT